MRPFSSARVSCMNDHVKPVLRDFSLEHIIHVLQHSKFYDHRNKVVRLSKHVLIYNEGYCYNYKDFNNKVIINDLSEYFFENADFLSLTLSKELLIKLLRNMHLLKNSM